MKAIDMYRNRVEREWLQVERIIGVYSLTEAQVELLRRTFIIGSIGGALASLNVISQLVVLIDERKQSHHVVKATIDGYCKDLRLELKALGRENTLAAESGESEVPE